MKIHNFSAPTAYAKPYAKPPFELHNITLEVFRQVNGGDFCSLPEGHEPCRPGFRPYRCANGNIVGLED
jgi:hypothetical protein